MADDQAQEHLALREIVRDANLLREKRRELDVLRQTFNRDWAENRAFFNGHQWIYYNRGNGQVESLGVDDTEKPRYKVRLTVNKTTPGVMGLVAQMTKTRPTIHAVPNSGADKDVKAAQLAERLYEYWWVEFGLRAKLTSALVHSQLSQGYWLITWDAKAGKPFRVMLNPQTGQPETDDKLADLYREEIVTQAEQAGVDPASVLQHFEKTLYLGDIKVQVLSGEQVWLDPVASNFEDANYFIARYPMDVDEIEARFGKRYAPDAVVGDLAPQLMHTRAREDRPKTAREVYCIFVRPNPAMPKGRYAYWVEGPNEILEEGDWEFPTHDLPLVKFPGIERPNSIYDTSRVSLVKPLQKELNNKISKIAMHMNLTMKPQMIAPIGSLRQRLTDEPGAVLEYAPIQNMAPEWRQIPTIPSQAFEYVAQIQTRIDQMFNAMPTERSQLPPRTDSGQLLDLMQEATADQIAPEIQRMEDSLARAGRLMASLAKRFYIEARTLKIFGPGGSVRSQKFFNSDLEGGYDFQAEAGSGLPRTRAGQIQQIKELIEMQVISPQEALPYLPIGGLKSVQTKLAADEDFAYRKIDKLVQGEPLNVSALEQAMQQVQTGVNPDTQAPFQSPDEAIAFVQTAALQPVPYENYQTSLNVLREHMTGYEFEKYPPDVQQRFVGHFNALYQVILSMPQGGQPPRITLGLNATVGPTVAANLLRNAGVMEATPETMAEPPLETSVYDSVDKADADDAGNDPLTALEQAQSMTMAADQHAVKQAKASHELDAAQHSSELSHLAQGLSHEAAIQQQGHAQELHDQKLRHAEAVHAEKLRQMRKPKPATTSKPKAA